MGIFSDVKRTYIQNGNSFQQEDVVAPSKISPITNLLCQRTCHPFLYLHIHLAHTNIILRTLSYYRADGTHAAILSHIEVVLEAQINSSNNRDSGWLEIEQSRKNKVKRRQRSNCYILSMN